jgi:hypothetical protein
MRPETSFVDHHIGPHTREQLFLANHFSYVLNKCNQDVQGAAADIHWYFVFEEASL